MTLFRGALLAAVLTCALPSIAALAPRYQELGSGPVQWIMTGEEQRDWKRISTDQEAEKFIELFWARRDPTPGTPLNEFKADFDDRIRFADAEFPDRDTTGAIIKRGALSDRGRVLLVLGHPPNQRTASRARNDIFVHTAEASDQVRVHGSRDIWIWEQDEAQPKFDMPRVEVGFVEDPRGGIWRRDVQRHDYLSAEAAAIRKAIVNPDLKEVPGWARPQVPGAEPGVVIARKGEAGAHRLLLMTDPRAIENSDLRDPFADVQTVSVFGRNDDLGYVVEYCGAHDPVTLRVAIRGTANGRPVNAGPPAAIAHPEAIKTVPGCSMLRAALSLGGLPMLTTGTFTFIVQVDDGAQRYNLAQEFKIE